MREETDPRPTPPGEGRSEQQNAPTELRDTEAPGATAEADAAFGILGDFVAWYRDGSTATTPGRWGDFLRTHRSHVTPAHLDGFGYFTNTDATGAIVQNPYHVRYGR